MAVLNFRVNFDAIFYKLDIAFLRYGNFIDDIITDWWKVDSEKKVLDKFVNLGKCIAVQYHTNTYPCTTKKLN